MNFPRVNSVGPWYDLWVSDAAQWAGRNSVAVEQAAKSGDYNLIDEAVDKAIAPVQDAVRNTLTVVLLAGLGYVAFKAWVVKKTLT